jgi:glycerol-3-phosphate dehydrogenase
MPRDLRTMADTHHDLLIVGGGITGACIAWDAALRGLRVALVERRDFGGATSAATSKLIHGGLRYLRQGEFALVRESLHERRVLERIAPHQVYPIPFLIPTYRGRQGRVPLTLGMIVYELLAYDRGQADLGDKPTPPHRTLTHQEVLRMEPGVRPDDLTGGVLYYDCQVHSPERLTLEFVLSAAHRGAQTANRAEVQDFLVEGGRVCGARVKDQLSGGIVEIRAPVVVNAAGPWADLLVRTLGRAGPERARRVIRSKGIHVVTRPVTRGNALVLITREGRHVFLIPWREHTLIGTTDTPYSGHPDDLSVTAQEISELLGEVNSAYPSARLALEDVLVFYVGLRPLVDQEGGGDTYHASRRYEIHDHGEEGRAGLLTVVGGKYTTSRSLARKVVDRVFGALGQESPPCRTETLPLLGGNVGAYAAFLQRVLATEGGTLAAPLLENLVRTYGTRCGELIQLVKAEAHLGRPLDPDLPEIGAQVIHAVRREMALHLSDVVFRRTGLGAVRPPCSSALKRACDLMARELGWGRARRNAEIKEVGKAFEIS